MDCMEQAWFDSCLPLFVFCQSRLQCRPELCNAVCQCHLKCRHSEQAALSQRGLNQFDTCSPRLACVSFSEADQVLDSQKTTYYYSNMTEHARKIIWSCGKSLALARSGSWTLRNPIRSRRPDHRGPIHTRISNHSHMYIYIYKYIIIFSQLYKYLNIIYIHV